MKVYILTMLALYLLVGARLIWLGAEFRLLFSWCASGVVWAIMYGLASEFARPTLKQVRRELRRFPPGTWICAARGDYPNVGIHEEVWFYLQPEGGAVRRRTNRSVSGQGLVRLRKPLVREEVEALKLQLTKLKIFELPQDVKTQFERDAPHFRVAASDGQREMAFEARKPVGEHYDLVQFLMMATSGQEEPITTGEVKKQ